MEVDCEMVDGKERGVSAGSMGFAVGCKRKSEEATSQFLFPSSPTTPS